MTGSRSTGWRRLGRRAGLLVGPALVAALACGCIDNHLADELNWQDAGPPGAAGGGLDGGSGLDGSGWPPGEGGAPDTTPPWLVGAASCAGTERTAAELCVAEGPVGLSLRLWASEPVVALARVEGSGEVARADEPATEHHLVLAPLPSGTPQSVTVEVTDGAGLSADAGPLSAQTAAARPTVVINEVLFDPLGAEPDQEFVELHNYGSAPVSVDGWSLADEGGEDALVAPAAIPAGGYAVVVSARFSPGAGGDPPPGPGAVVIRLDGPIGSAGLRNDGEALTLRDEAGEVVSSYPALLSPPGPGASAIRVEALAPDGDPMNWASSGERRPTPGGANGG